MILKSFGDSFIFGSELADERFSYQADSRKDKNYLTGSQLTWPALLAKHYNYQYYTYARPGSGNLQILERLMSQFAGPVNDETICIVGWAWIDRFDYYVKNPTGTQQPWATVLPNHNNETSKIYYRDLHSELRDKLVNLLYMRQAIDFLKEKQIPFLMTYMDHLLFDTRWNTTPAVAELQTYVKPYMTTFEGLNFQEWAKKNNFPITKNGHPLEPAHQAAGEYMIKVFDTKSIGAHCHLV